MPLPLIVPLAMVTSGFAAILAAALSNSDDGEPAAPIEFDESAAPVVVPSASPTTDANEIEALARVIASEAGAGTPAEQKGIAWTVRNRFRGKSIYDGEYPWRAQKGSNPPFSSARPPNDGHRSLARSVLSAPQEQDPTGGATSFFEPKMQDIFFKAGELARAGQTGDRVIDGVKLTDITRFKNYKKDANAVRAKWGNGSTIYAVANRFEFWGSGPKFAKRGGQVKTIVGGWFDGAKPAFTDIPDPLMLLPKYKRRG